MKKFVKELVNEVEKALIGVRVAPVKTLKSNGVVLTGLNFVAEGRSVSPTIYVDKFLEMYENGMPLGNIVSQILSLYRSSRLEEDMDMSFYYDFAKVKDRICMRVLNFERNQELLQEVPHIRYLDLAFVFFYAFAEKVGGNDGAAILIHNNHLNLWGATAEDLYALSLENTPRIYQPIFAPIYDVIRMECGDCGSDLDERFAREFCPMWVVTNEVSCHGATALFYPRMLDYVSERIGGSFYVLPSSRDEVIILSKIGVTDKERDEETLFKMIYEINRSVVSEEDFLTDTLYYYDSETKELRIVGGAISF